MVTPHEIRQRILKRIRDGLRPHVIRRYTTRDSPENTETIAGSAGIMAGFLVTPHEIRQRILKQKSQLYLIACGLVTPHEIRQRILKRMKLLSFEAYKVKLHHTRFAREY